MSEYSLRIIVLPSLVYPCFELDIEQDEIRIALLIKKKLNETNHYACFANSSILE